MAETVSCNRCGKPIHREKKVSDFSDTCYECLTDDEKEEMMSPEVQEESIRRLMGN